MKVSYNAPFLLTGQAQLSQSPTSTRLTQGLHSLLAVYFAFKLVGGFPGHTSRSDNSFRLPTDL